MGNFFWSKTPFVQKVFFRICAVIRSLFFLARKMASNFFGRKKAVFAKGLLPHLCGYKVTLFFRAPQMGVYKVKWSFFECRKWVFIRSQNFQNHPQAGDYKVKCWFCARPYNHPPPVNKERNKEK